MVTEGRPVRAAVQPSHTQPRLVTRDNSTASARSAPYRVIVNFGCGPTPAAECLNIDGSLTVLLAKLPVPPYVFGRRAEFVRAVRLHRVKYATARRLRFPEASLDAFYSSHTLEHLPRGECVSLLVRAYAWLRPGGVLRIVLPDLSHAALAYVSGAIDADTFVRRLRLSVEGQPWWSVVFGHAHHRWMYDTKSLARILEGIGYQEIKACEFRESRLNELAALDMPERREESLYVEAIRPLSSAPADGKQQCARNFPRAPFDLYNCR